MTETTDATAPSGKLSSEKIFQEQRPSGILSATFAESTRTLYTASMDGKVEAFELDSRTTATIGQHQSYASGVVTTADANVMVSSGYDGLLIWHDIQKKHPIHVVQAHTFWSWRLAVSPDGKAIASSTGQYLAGGYKYEPAAEREPSVKIFNATNGNQTHEFSHTPPVTSLTFSPDNRFVAAGNLMGEIRVYDLATSKQVAEWTTPDFTSWGIIKSHHYIGGIFDLAFTPNGEELIACGMGPMRDPMAGNGKQTWQRFDWQSSPPAMQSASNDQDTGKGLMETLAIDPSNARFVMAGRLAQGQWNTGVFSLETGKLLHSLDTKMRTSKAILTDQGNQLLLCGATSQKEPKDGKWPDFGRILSYQIHQS